MKNQVRQSPDVQASVGQIADIAAAMMAGIPRRLNFHQATRLISRKRQFAEEVKSAFHKLMNLSVAELTADEQLEDWYQFYYQLLGMNLPIGEIKVPPRKPGFDRLLVVANGISVVTLLDAYKKLSSRVRVCFPYQSLGLKKDFWHLNLEPYAIWTREEQNASGAFSGKLDRRVMTLLERLIYGLLHRKVSQRLDARTVTVCAASREDQGVKITVYQDLDELFVQSEIPEWADPRVREVITE